MEAFNPEEYELKIPRSEEVQTAINELSEYIASLSLTASENSRLVELAADVTLKVERSAFLEGFDLGTKATKEPESEAEILPLPHFTGELK